MEFKGTQGEWELDYDEDSGTFTLWVGDAVVERHTGSYPTVGEIELYSGWWPEQLEFPEVKANCRLLAASRELLEACQALPDFDIDNPEASDFKDNAEKFMRSMRLARAAIAKALGDG